MSASQYGNQSLRDNKQANKQQVFLSAFQKKTAIKLNNLWFYYRITIKTKNISIRLDFLISHYINTF